MIFSSEMTYLIKYDDFEMRFNLFCRYDFESEYDFESDMVWIEYDFESDMVWIEYDILISIMNRFWKFKRTIRCEISVWLLKRPGSDIIILFANTENHFNNCVRGGDSRNEVGWFSERFCMRYLCDPDSRESA